MTAGPGRRPTPLQLAYIGDAVWELHVRTKAVAGTDGSMDDIHRRVVGRVQASAQAALWRTVEGALTEEELTVARRARNARLTPPRGVSHVDYRYGTSFETVLGYLYWMGRLERLREVMRIADEAGAEPGR